MSCQVIKLNSKDSLSNRCLELENILSKINGYNYINNNNKLYIKEVFIESPYAHDRSILVVVSSLSEHLEYTK